MEQITERTDFIPDKADELFKLEMNAILKYEDITIYNDIGESSM